MREEKVVGCDQPILLRRLLGNVDQVNPLFRLGPAVAPLSGEDREQVGPALQGRRVKHRAGWRSCKRNNSVRNLVYSFLDVLSSMGKKFGFFSVLNPLDMNFQTVSSILMIYQVVDRYDGLLHLLSDISSNTLTASYCGIFPGAANEVSSSAGGERKPESGDMS